MSGPNKSNIAGNPQDAPCPTQQLNQSRLHIASNRRTDLSNCPWSSQYQFICHGLAKVWPSTNPVSQGPVQNCPIHQHSSLWFIQKLSQVPSTRPLIHGLTKIWANVSPVSHGLGQNWANTSSFSHSPANFGLLTDCFQKSRTEPTLVHLFIVQSHVGQ